MTTLFISHRSKAKPVFLLAAAEIAGTRHADVLAPAVPQFLEDMQYISLADLTRSQAYERLWAASPRRV